MSILCLKQVFDIEKLFFTTKTTAEKNNFPCTVYTLYLKYLCAMSANFIYCSENQYVLSTCVQDVTVNGILALKAVFFALNY